MKYNRRTLALAAVGLVTIPSVLQAEEKPSSVLSALSATTLSGYVSTSAIWEPGTSTANIPGRAFDGPSAKQDGFNVDVVSLMLSKALDETAWSAGYTVQLWLGPDAAGFNTSFPNASVAGGDFAVKQAFVDLHAPIGTGLDIKLGHFNYIGGFEQPDAGLNPNYSRSFAWTQEPASHTGLLLSYVVNPVVSFMGGIANTVNNGVNWRAVRGPNPSETEKTYMANVTLTAPTNGFGSFGGSTLAATIVNGLNNASGDAGTTLTRGHTTSLNISATTPTPVTNLKVGLSYDYTDGPNLPGALPTVDTRGKYINVVTAYAFYQATEKLKFAGRGEYTSASKGAWYGPPAGSQRAELMGWTGTIDYALWKNVISRGEMRWDHSLTGDRPYGGSVAAPGGEKNVITFALNMIYNF